VVDDLHSFSQAAHARNYLAGNRMLAPMCFNVDMETSDTGLSITLQRARRARRMSQLALSLQVGVSQRHISFVESGRAKPSRELLLHWLQTLGVSLANCNQALLQAGFAPVYAEAALHDPTLAMANQALDALLAAHDPMPAIVLDASWNFVKLNRGARALAAWIAPEWMDAQGQKPPANMLDLLMQKSVANRILNWSEIAPALLMQLRQEALSHPALSSRVEALAELIAHSNRHRAKPAPALSPVLSTRFASDYGELSFFSMFTTFGRPHDITLASLRVEHMFAADAATAQIMRSHVRIDSGLAKQ
jgi:transcriptional regulator with XRE-family HTH domain